MTKVEKKIFGKFIEDRGVLYPSKKKFKKYGFRLYFLKHDKNRPRWKTYFFDRDTTGNWVGFNYPFDKVIDSKFNINWKLVKKKWSEMVWA